MIDRKIGSIACSISSCCAPLLPWPIAAVSTAVCTENLSSGVVVVKAAQDGKGADHTGSLNQARSGRILIQGQVSPRLIIVASVRFQNPAQTCLAQDNDVLHTFSPDRSDQPFGKAVLPR